MPLFKAIADHLAPRRRQADPRARIGARAMRGLELARDFRGALSQIIEIETFDASQRNAYPAAPGVRPGLGDRLVLQCPESADGRAVAIRIPTRGDDIADCGTEIIGRAQQGPHNEREIVERMNWREFSELVDDCFFDVPQHLFLSYSFWQRIMNLTSNPLYTEHQDQTAFK